jgi:hypothetical protein
MCPIPYVGVINKVFKKQSFYMVTAGKLEEMIEREFGISFSIVADQEIGNQELVLYGVQSKLTSYDFAEIKMWQEKNGSSCYIFQTLMAYLCRKGKIPAGDYVIDCTW